MDLIRRMADTPLAPSDKQVAYYQGVRILALVAARKSAEAREEIKRIGGMQIDIRESYRRLVDECARDRTKLRAFVPRQSRALFYEAAGLRQRATEHYKGLTRTTCSSWNSSPRTIAQSTTSGTSQRRWRKCWRSRNSPAGASTCRSTWRSTSV